MTCRGGRCLQGIALVFLTVCTPLACGGSGSRDGGGEATSGAAETMGGGAGSGGAETASGGAETASGGGGSGGESGSGGAESTSVGGAMGTGGSGGESSGGSGGTRSSTTGSSTNSTDGDGVAELSGAPILPAALSVSDTSMDVELPVDSDTVRVDVYLHEVGDQDSVYGYANNQEVDAGTTHTVSLAVSGLTEGAEYYVQLITCAADTSLCQFGATMSPSDTGYVDTEPPSAGVYQRFNMQDGQQSATTLTIPTVTAN